ncbi:MAG: peptidylprolyl isomerase [Roseateles sp.]|uniref:peptidylprolyl isomerase n=1 Tax=Roseateles sp. TaxID=1971397 RepID=UPI0040360DD0
MTLLRPRRRPLLALAAATTVALTLAACGGGGGDSGTPVQPPTPPVTIGVTHKVRLTTNQGVIELGLDRNRAPVTVDNFLKYVNDGFYDGTVFHRVINNFVIQGGGIIRTNAGLSEKAPTYPAITLESQNGLSNMRGTLAMARTSVANSATSQFYVNVVDNLNLNYVNAANPGYAVFGQVTVGMDVVDKIRAVNTNAQDVPLVDVTITEAKVIQ